MADSKQWFMKWNVGDWLSDPAVSMLRPSTRGVWFDAICRMHQLDAAGEITGTVNELAGVLRSTANEVLAAISDLIFRNAADILDAQQNQVIREANGRLTALGESVNGNTVVTLRNRRMHREWTCRKSGRDRKRKHDAVSSSGHGNGKVTPHSKSNSNSYSKIEDLPQPLQTREFAKVWGEWVQHRKEIRHALTPTTERLQIAKCEALGPDRAVVALKHSMSNGWQGIFEPDGKSKQSQNGSDTEAARQKRQRAEEIL